MPDAAAFGDLEVWLCGHLRAGLSAPSGHTLVVDVREPAPRPAGFIVLVRVDGSDQVSLVTEEVSVGVRLIGPDSDVLGQLTGQLARQVRQLIASAAQPGPGVPVTFVAASRGPYRVVNTDHARPEWYQTADLRVAAEGTY